MNAKRKRTIGLVAAVVVLAASGGAALAVKQPAAAAGPEITVYKSPTCGCCTAWVEHLRENGFDVNAQDTDQLARIKADHGVPRGLQACHTAVVDGYIIEGHVPAEVIRRFLDEAPDAAGLAVPGMPVGSPGMEVPGRPDEPYDILAFDRDGKTSVYESR